MISFNKQLMPTRETTSTTSCRPSELSFSYSFISRNHPIKTQLHTSLQNRTDLLPEIAATTALMPAVVMRREPYSVSCRFSYSDIFDKNLELDSSTALLSIASNLYNPCIQSAYSGANPNSRRVRTLNWCTTTPCINSLNFFFRGSSYKYGMMNERLC